MDEVQIIFDQIAEKIADSETPEDSRNFLSGLLEMLQATVPAYTPEEEIESS